MLPRHDRHRDPGRAAVIRVRSRPVRLGSRLREADRRRQCETSAEGPKAVNIVTSPRQPVMPSRTGLRASTAGRTTTWSSRRTSMSFRPRLRALVRRSKGEGEPAPVLPDRTRGARSGRENRDARRSGDGSAAERVHVAPGVCRRPLLSREQLVERMYRWGDEVESNAGEVHVHQLRCKPGPRGREDDSRSGVHDTARRPCLRRVWAVYRAADPRPASRHNPARHAGGEHWTNGHDCSTACCGMSAPDRMR